MIHALSLALVLAVQGAPSHADLHPAEADVYVELGDLTTVLPALDGAPMLRLLRDARVKGLLEQMGKAEGSLADLAQKGLLEAMPEAKPETWFPGVKAISLSVMALGPSSGDTPSVAWLALVDFAAAEQAQALHAVLVANATKHEPMTAALSGVELLTMGEEAEDQMWAVAAGTRLVVGSKPTKVEDYAARADKKVGGLGRDEAFQKRFASFDKPSGTPMLWFALNRPLKDIVAKVKGPEGAAFFDRAPNEINPFARPGVARLQLVGERFVTEMISEAGATAGKPVDAKWLEPAPSTAMLLYATAFDGVEMGKRMRALLAQDEQSAATLTALEAKLGYGPERVLGRLGPGMMVYSGPLAGMGLPEMRFWIDCEDPAAFTAEFEALVKALGETLPGFEAKTKPYKVKQTGSDEKIEVPITTLTLPPGMEIPMVPLSPSFAPVGKRLVFGMGSMDVKSELKRVHGGEGEPIVAGKNPLAALGFTLPAEARSVVVMDWAKLLGSALDMFKAFAPMAGDQIPFDVTKLPPGSIFAEFFKPTFHYSKPVASGHYRRNEGSFGPETWIGLAGAAAVIGRAVPEGGPMDGSMPSEPITPPEPPGGDGQ